jgi:hypothetical protein
LRPWFLAALFLIENKLGINKLGIAPRRNGCGDAMAQPSPGRFGRTLERR